jgi:peptidylprolyl isomerase/peptidyl-prolyl cis-trans isomerase B (cyclophilin B)
VSPKSKVRKKPAKYRDPRAQARHAAYEASRKSTRRKWTLAAAVVLAVVLVFAATQVFDAGPGDDPTVDSTDTTVASVPAGTPVSLPTPAKGASITGDTPCPNADGSSPRTTSFAKAPPTCTATGKTYYADIQTSKGLITIALDPTAAPKTVNNFVVLARYHYFDTLPFHRIVQGFVVQGGSPDATGSGGPGYAFADELPSSNVYVPGTLAMANSGPNTNGSQFFIVSGDASHLQPSYSFFGKVTAGMDVVSAIDAVGTPNSSPQAGAPTEVVTIQSVTIKES